VAAAEDGSTPDAELITDGGEARDRRGVVGCPSPRSARASLGEEDKRVPKIGAKQNQLL